MIPEKCVSETNDSRISLNDKQSVSAIFLNPGRVLHRCIRFDGCVVKNKTACDWILEKPGVGRIVVELKGRDVPHAIEQVEAGLNHLKDIGMIELKLAALIVCTRYSSHPTFTTSMQKAKSKLAKIHKARLHITKDGRDLNFEGLLNSSS